MSWEDLQEHILEEFTEVSRYSVEDAFAAYSEHLTRHSEQHKKDCKAYRDRKRLDPVWRAKERERKRQPEYVKKQLVRVRIWKAKQRQKIREAKERKCTSSE